MSGETPQAIIAQIPDKLIRALPPAFVLLIVLNILFMGALTYAVQHNSSARNELLNKIIDTCLKRDAS